MGNSNGAKVVVEMDPSPGEAAPGDLLLPLNLPLLNFNDWEL